LDADCQIVQAIQIHALGDWLVTFRDGAAPTAASFEPSGSVAALPEGANCYR